MKDYRFYYTEIPLPLAVMKDSLEIYFQEIEKLLPMEGIFEILETLFPLARKSVSTSQNEGFVENKFTIDGKSLNKK